MIKHRFFDKDILLQSELARLVNEEKLIPVIGSGFTRGCPSKKGLVPSGSDMTQYMKNVLSIKYKKDISSFSSTPFAKLCTSFDKQTSIEEKFEYFSDNFTKVEIDKDKINFLLLGWPYIYTLNIDDGIEKNSQYEVILPRKEFYEKYIEEFESVFKVHGDVHTYLKYLDSDDNREEIIFNKKQYIDSLRENKKMLSKFEDDFGTSNLLYIGCSLDDEPDLLSVVSASLKNVFAHREVYYVFHKELDQEMQDNLEDYGITTCIVVSDYNKFYTTLKKNVSKLPKTKKSLIDFYHEPKVSQLDDKDSTLNFMLTSDNLTPVPYKRNILRPHFFIKRDIINSKILKELKTNSPIHIVYGHRISGKTYCLFGIYESIKDKDRYFFPSNTQITENILDELINKKDSALFFDTQTLTSEQLTKILTKKRMLDNNNTYIIICINTSDRYAVNLIADNINYKSTLVKNIFSKNESIKINTILETTNIPQLGFVEYYFDVVKNEKKKRYSTLLDNLFKLAVNFGDDDSHYIFPNLELISKDHDLAIIILLATQQAINSYDMYYFDIVKECADFSNKFPTLAEWIYINEGLTRKGSKQRLSATTRYYLLKILGDYAENAKKHTEIIDAYKYIYEKISNAETTNFEITRKMLDYVKFDVINDIFSKRKNPGVAKLIKSIYESLEPVMNTNPQFKHQRAKSILWLSKDDFGEITKAISYIDLAYHNTETMIKTSRSNFLRISLGHISYTRSLLLGRKCSIEHYSSEENIKLALSYYREALLNPVNKEELDALRTRKADRRIRSDLQKLIESVLNTTGFDPEITKTAQELREDLNCF